MDKVYVVYWSQTGNTEAMANMLKEGIEANGAVAELVEAGDADIIRAKRFRTWLPCNGF